MNILLSTKTNTIGNSYHYLINTETKIIMRAFYNTGNDMQIYHSKREINNIIDALKKHDGYRAIL